MRRPDLPEGIPVAAGMFDINACGIASGLSDEEQMCMVAGTWSINEYISKEPVTNGTVALNSLFCMPGYYLIEESSPTSAGNMEWFIRNLMSYEKAEAKENGGSVYDITNEWVASIEPQDNNIIFLPFLNGSNEDPLAKGTFVGLTAYHNKKHMLRAVYEGIVFSHVTHVNKLLRNRERPKSVRLSGGAANSDVWVQIFADALQLPIDVIEDKELGAQGAAMAAGIAAGIYKDYQDAMRRTVKITKTIQPRPEYADIYKEKYADIPCGDRRTEWCVEVFQKLGKGRNHRMSKAYELGLYEKAMPGTLTWKERLEAAKAAGYDYVEISIDATEEKIARLDMDRESRLELVKTMYETGIPIRTMCVSALTKYAIGSSDPKHAVQEEWRSWKNHFSWQMILESVL